MSRLRILTFVAGGAIALATPLIIHFEGTELIAKPDPIGIPTFCEGITHVDGVPVVLGQVATPEECARLRHIELTKAVATVNRNVTVPINDYQRAAWASLVYNIGETAFARSTLVKKANRGDIRGACEELRRWVYAGGRKLNGLVRRREAEREMCLRGVQ